MVSVPVRKQDYDSVLSGAIKALPDRSSLPFETGERGQAAESLARYLILARVPNLNVAAEINSASARLIASYAEVNGKGKPIAGLAEADIAAVNDYVEKQLGAPAKNEGKTYTIDEVKKEAIVNHYPNLEALGLQFSEINPKPFRSSLIVPLLLQRIDGLDASVQVNQAVKVLEDGYKGVPKANGTEVEEVEAQSITRIAREKTGEAITALLGSKITY